jgi:drug/metabolite transporter (DMT)-like permease
MLATLLRVALASAIAGLACALGVSALHGMPRSWAVELLVVFGGIVVALGIGYGAMKLLRVEELSALEDLLRAMRRRFTGA